jgi:UDP-glucose:(heptosyl)LPS alpha-1,3-glucosyltransferase
MRIAVVSPFLDRRHGTERCIVEQIERIAREPGCEIHIYSQRVEDLAVLPFSRGAFPAMPGSLFWHKVPSIHGPYLFQFLWWFQANRVKRWFDAHFRSLRFDLVFSPGINCLDADAIAVHIVFHEFHRLAREELRFRNVPFRDWPRLVHRRLYYRLIRMLEKRVYPVSRVRLAAVSRLTASELTRHFGRSDVTVIPNAVDTAVFHPAARVARRAAARHAFALGRNDVLLLLLGNDWKKKGLACLLKAMAACPDLPLRTLVAGRDDPSPYRPVLERLGLQHRVQFVGSSPDVLQFYAAADVYVGPSLHDSFALPPAEAMACGLPVITSSQNGGAEMITDGEDGFVLSDPRDSAALASLLRRLCEQPDLRRRIGANAARTSQEYTWERNATETRAFLSAAFADKHTSKALMRRP